MPCWDVNFRNALGVAPWSLCLAGRFSPLGTPLEESVATDKPSQKFRTDEEIVRGATEQKDGEIVCCLFPRKWTPKKAISETSENQFQIPDS